MNDNTALQNQYQDFKLVLKVVAQHVIILLLSKYYQDYSIT